jgi:hypothetical protein
MDYLHVTWKHDFPDEPVELYSELDDERWETRKVYLFADGHTAYADEQEEAGTGLSELPLPPLSEIAADPQFLPRAITRDEFERVWNARKS